jgi:hypothetical protein
VGQRRGCEHRERYVKHRVYSEAGGAGLCKAE